MAIDDQNLPESVNEIQRQLCVSFATVNRRENGQVKPSKLAEAQFDNFCVKKIRQRKMKLSGGDK